MDQASIDGIASEEVVDGVHLAQLATGERMNVQHYRFEPGSAVPVHRHPAEQSGFVYRGALTFVLENGRETEAAMGTAYVLPANATHGVENRGEIPALGVDIFSPPRERPAWTD